MVPQSLIDELLSLEWFAHCGQPAEQASAIVVARKLRYLRSAGEALSSVSLIDTENDDLDIANAYRAQLRKLGKMRPGDWNLVASQARAFVRGTLLPLVQPRLRGAGLAVKSVEDHVDWHAIHMFQELAHGGESGDQINSSVYLPVYRAGRLPCGWAGGWRSGTLLVF